MNTIDKVRALEKTIRNQQHTIKTIVGTIDRLNKKNTSLSKRIDNLEDILIDKLQEIFEGDESPLSEIEERLLKLESIKEPSEYETRLANANSKQVMR